MAVLITGKSKQLDIISRVGNATAITFQFWNNSTYNIPISLSGKTFQVIVEDYRTRVAVKTFSPTPVSNTISVKWEEDDTLIQNEAYFRYKLRVTEGSDYSDWIIGTWRFVYSDEDATPGQVNLQVLSGGNVVNIAVGGTTIITGGGEGGGDMFKVTYDGNNNGSVDNAEQLYDGTNTVSASQARSHIDNTSNPHSVTKTQIGLSNVDNTADVGKPVSTAQAAAISAVAETAGTIKTKYESNSDTNAYTDAEQAKVANLPANQSSVNSTTAAHVADSSIHLDASDIDALNRSVSALQQAAIDVVGDSLAAHEIDTSNPHDVTKAQVGLSNVDNTSDAGKPVSTAQQAAIDVVADDLTSHESDASIHLDQADIQSIGDARWYTETETVFELDSDSNAAFPGQAYSDGGVIAFSATASFNLNDGNVQQMTLTAAITTLSLTNKKSGATYRIFLIQDGTGAHAIATPDASFGTQTDNSADFILTANAVNIIDVSVRPDGTTYYSIETITA